MQRTPILVDIGNYITDAKGYNDYTDNYIIYSLPFDAGQIIVENYTVSKPYQEVLLLVIRKWVVIFISFVI